MSSTLSFSLLLILIISVGCKTYKLFLPWFVIDFILLSKSMLLLPLFNVGLQATVGYAITFSSSCNLLIIVCVCTGIGTIGFIFIRIFELIWFIASASVNATLIFMQTLFIGRL